MASFMMGEEHIQYLWYHQALTKPTGGFGLAVALISLFDRIGLFECTVSAIAGSVAIISASATLLESLPINSWLDDNLSVPVLAAVLGQYLFASSVVFLA